MVKRLERTQSRPWLGRRRPGTVRGLRRKQHGQSREQVASPSARNPQQGRRVTKSKVPTTPSRESPNISTGAKKPISDDGNKQGDQTEGEKHTWEKIGDLTKQPIRTHSPSALSHHPTLFSFLFLCHSFSFSFFSLSLYSPLMFISSLSIL